MLTSIHAQFSARVQGLDPTPDAHVQFSSRVLSKSCIHIDSRQVGCNETSENAKSRSELFVNFMLFL